MNADPGVDLDEPLAPDDRSAAPHDASGEAVATRDLADAGATGPAGPPRWTPKRVVVTPAALDHPHGRRIVARVEAQGMEVERLRANRLTGVRGAERAGDVRPGEVDAGDRGQPAVAAASCSRSRRAPTGGSTWPRAARRTASTATSPARCPGPPVTRVYADLDDILAGLSDYVGQGDGHQPQRPPRAARAPRSRRPATPIRWRWNTSPAAGSARSSTSAPGTRRSSCAGPPSSTTSTASSACRTRVAPGCGSASTPAHHHPDGGRHQPARGPARRPAPAGPGRLPGRTDDRADHADGRLARALRRTCSTLVAAAVAACRSST